MKPAQSTGLAYRAAYVQTYAAKQPARNPYSVWRNPRLWAAHYDGVQAAQSKTYNWQFNSVKKEFIDGLTIVGFAWMIAAFLLWGSMELLRWILF